MHDPVLSRAHLRSGSAISLFLVLPFIGSSAEKSASHNQVDEKASEVELVRLQLWI